MKKAVSRSGQPFFSVAIINYFRSSIFFVSLKFPALI
jgi:hypothetical protein